MLRLGAILAVAILAAALLVEITTIYPIVHVRWAQEVSDQARSELERDYGLTKPEPIGEHTYRYLLLDVDADNVGGLVRSPAVADTQHIDRETYETAVGRDISLRLPVPSLIVILCGLLMLGAGDLACLRWRRLAALAVLAVFAAAVLVVTVPDTIKMGDADVLADFGGGRDTTSLRIEAHLSYALLEWLGRFVDTGQRSMERVQWLTRGAGLLYAGELAGLMMMGAWSPAIVRYAALAMAAPVTFTYFGYVELAMLSLTALGFPLLMRGLQSGGAPLDAAAAVFGWRSAFHSFGLLSLLGTALAALGWRAPWRTRIGYLLRAFAFGSAFYLIWLFLYLVVMKVQIEPGHASDVPLRSIWTATVSERRLNVPILSTQGMRDIVASLWLAGLPLIAVAMAGWKTARPELRAALLFTVPSVLFSVAFWPIQGVAVEVDLLLAAFPAVFALLYVCAQDRRSSWAAGLTLISMHGVMWYVMQAPAFVNHMDF